jgi:hypothetical protein
MWRTRWSLLFFFAVVMVALLIGGWLLWPQTAIRRDNAAKIREGMMLIEVEAILGGPPRDDSNGPVSHDDGEGGWVIGGNQYEAALEGDNDEVIGRERHWYSDTALVTVRFDLTDRVTEIRHRPLYPVERGAWESLRRWLRL